MAASVVFLLLVFGLWSTVLGDGGNPDPGGLDSQEGLLNETNCPLHLEPNVKIPRVKCSAPSYDCSRITCTARLSDKDFTLSMDIDQSRENISAYIIFSVPGTGFSWSHLFKDGDKLEIPGFPLDIEGFVVGANVFLQLSLSKSNGTIDFKVDLQAVWTELTQKTYTVTIVEGKIPVPPEPELPHCYGPIAVPNLMVVVYPLLFLGLPLVIAACLAFLCKKKKFTTADQLQVQTPSYDEATSTTSGPLQVKPPSYDEATSTTSGPLQVKPPSYDEATSTTSGPLQVKPPSYDEATSTTSGPLQVKPPSYDEATSTTADQLRVKPPSYDETTSHVPRPRS